MSLDLSPFYCYNRLSANPSFCKRKYQWTMELVKMKDIKPGDKLFCDNGFSCLAPRTICEVKKNENGFLFIECNFGMHFLDGQLNEDGSLEGLTIFDPDKFQQDL